MEDQGFEPFDKLLKEISAAESKLDQLQLSCHNDGDGKKSINLEAVALKEEDVLLKQEPPEGLVEDDESQYFIAVGLIEQEIENLRKIKMINSKQSSYSEMELEKLRYNSYIFTCRISFCSVELNNLCSGKTLRSKKRSMSILKKN